MYRTILASLIAMTVLPAAAETVPISLSESHFGLPDFYTVETTFNLPNNSSDVTLTITSFNVDDRGVLLLNGVVVASSGIFGPGLGSMVLTSGGANNPFIFDYGNSGPFVPITSGFVSGLNSLSIIVNDTNAGITGNLSGGVNCGFPGCLAPTSLSFTAEVTFNTSTVPIPATLPLFCTGLAGVVSSAKRRRHPPATL